MTGWHLAALALAALAATPAAGQEAGSVAPFVGSWTVTQAAPGDGAPAVEPSAFDIRIEGDDDGVIVTWTPVGPNGAAEPGSVSFEAAERPGLFAAEDLAVPMEGEAMAWLRIADGTFTLYRMEVEAGGSFAIESRRLSPGADGAAMEAEVVLVADGHPAGTTRLRLAKGG